MKIGDIILIPFPFAELKNVKVRPAVVIAETADKYKDLVISAISSVVPEILNPNEILINPNNRNKLRVQSVIKVDRIMTLKHEDKIADLGKLTASEIATFKKVFTELVK
jgi:mRNA interferase MazF